jgi:hypothetical protein
MWEYTSSKRVTMILTYHNYEMHSKINKANKEEIKPSVVYDYNENMTAIHLRDQMLRPYLLKQKDGSKWYTKLFRRLLGVVLHNSIYQSIPHNMGTDPVKFRLLRIQGLTEKHRYAIPHHVYGCSSTRPPPKRLTEHHFLEKIPTTGKKDKPQRRCVTWSKHG